MKSSKTLIILLIIPFAIALLSFISVIVLNNTVAADISDIIWGYKQNVGFFLTNEPYKLEAEAVVDESLVLAPGNELTWRIENIDAEDKNEYAKIEQVGDEFYLHTLKEGECKVICSNLRGTKSKFFNAFIYKDGKIIVNTKHPRSGASIEDGVYFGQYDLEYNSLSLDGATSVNATIELTTSLLGCTGDVYSKALTTNVKIENEQIVCLGDGEASVEFYTNSAPYLSTVYKFNIIKDAHNIYSYNDLLMCTNFSSEGKKACLQVNLESLKNTYVNQDGRYIETFLKGKEDNKLFGNFSFSNQTFNFNNEICLIESTYNTKFIDQYNLEKGTTYDKNIKVGIHLKADLYGNGFTINAHGLAYPNHGTYNEAGKLVPTVNKDYFFGPLSYATIGDLVNMPVVKAYGQDNTLIYVDGDNININNIIIRNTDEIDNMYNLLYTGSVIDVHGHNNTIKNSILSNGRNIVRAYSADGLVIDNCILKTAAQFLLSIGSDQYSTYDENKNVSASLNGNTYSDNFVKFYDTENKNGALAVIDPIMESSAVSDPNKLNDYLSALNDIQKGLDDIDEFIDDSGNVIFSDEINLSRSYFYNSGVFSIAFETLFNGPFLYNGMVPSSVENFVSMFGAVLPNKIGGTSSPVKLNIDDKTKFYDFKDIETIDTSILIEENISTMIKILAGKEIPLSMDDFYPMKDMLKEQVKKLGYIYEDGGKQYINTKIAWYGGGKNLSQVAMSEETFTNNDMSKPIEVDVTSSILQGKYISNIHDMVILLSKCVSLATGFHSFNFITNSKVMNIPLDFGQVPQISDLIDNLK